MRYALLLALVVTCGAIYFYEEPGVWNQIMAYLFPKPAPIAEGTFVPPDPLPAKPHWTWRTTDGKTYNDVVVKEVEADCVTILDSDGGARIDISTLPPDIRYKLNYDPDLAAEASVKRSMEDRESERALYQERLLAEKIRREKQIATEKAEEKAQEGQ